MANFYLNRYSGESHESQWINYLQNSSYTSDITSNIANQTNEYAKCSLKQIDAIKDSSRLLSETLDFGFDEISDDLADIASEISGLTSMLEKKMSIIDWRMSMMVEEQKITNILSENVGQLLRIPDFQKERQYYIEQGLRFLKNSQFDKDLYNDALDNFLKAEEKEKTDYFVLHRIGMIYQYVPKLLNIAKAEEYFRKAAKYAFVESHPYSVKLFNILSGNLNARFSEQSNPQAIINEIASESFFQAGISCYIIGKFDEAAELTGQAFHLDPKMLEAGFTQAKALSLSGKVSNAVPILENIISKDRNYSVKTSLDIDLAPIAEVKNLLYLLRNDVNKKAKERLEKYKNHKSIDNKVIELLKKIEKLIECNTYLEGLAALDELSKKRFWNATCKDLNIEEYLIYEQNRLIEIRKLQEDEQKRQLQILRDAKLAEETERLAKEERVQYAKGQLKRGLDEQNKQDKKWFLKDYSILT